MTTTEHASVCSRLWKQGQDLGLQGGSRAVPLGIFRRVVEQAEISECDALNVRPYEGQRHSLKLVLSICLICDVEALRELYPSR